MTTTCAACGAHEQAGRFCTVCGTALTPNPGPSELTGATTAPEVRESTRLGAADMLRASAQSNQPPLATTGRRFAAYVLDILAVSLVALAVGVVVAFATGLPGKMAAASEVTTTLGAEAAATAVLSSLAVVYGLVGFVSFLGWLTLALLDGITGRTLGNRILGLRTVSAVGGSPIGAGRGLLRWLVLSLSGVVPVVGPILVLVSPNFDSSGRRQGWHDKASRAVVHDVRGVAPRTFAPASATAGPPSALHPAPVFPAAPAPGSAPQPSAGVAAPVDPWSFPAGDRSTGGVITGIPGSVVPQAAPTSPAPAPGSPAPAPVAPGPVDAPTVIGAPERAVTPQAAPPAPAAPAFPTPATSPTPAPAPADSGLAEDLEETRFSVSSHRSAGGAGTPPRIVVQLDTDRRVHVARRTLLGRNPQQDSGDAAELLRLEDTTRSVSKTHLELVPTAEGLQVSDLRSTNGSALIAPDGSVRELAPGTPVTVTVGWTVQLGERRLTVLGADAGA